MHVVDSVTGDTEFYEVFVTHDGSSVSDDIGTNVQSSPGTFLTSAAASISGANVILTLTNTAASTNPVNIKVQTLAFVL